MEGITRGCPNEAQHRESRAHRCVSKSSEPSFGAACSGLGLPPKVVSRSAEWHTTSYRLPWDTKQTPEGTLSYTYDAAGNVASIVSSNTNGINVSYTYDELGRLWTVVDNRLTGNNTTTYTYDAGSNLKTAAYPNSPANDPSTFTYDSLNRLTGLSTPVSSYSYQLGATGNRKSVTEGTNRAVNWTYDNIYRLTQEAVTDDPANKDGSVTYSLDPVGNRKTIASSLSGVNSGGTFTYTTDDELSPGEGDSYDNNGNTTHSGANSYTYDSENHLMTMNGTVAMLYDGDGNRVAKTVGGVTTRYLVDDLNPTGYPQVVEELTGSGSGTVVRQYTYGLERISENVVNGNGVWVPTFYGYDGAGSVRQLTNYATGQITDTYDYDAFGNKVNSTGSTPNNYLYRGEQYDSDLGLYYLRARDYNPATGRFLNVDPMAGDGQRRYQYAGADPVDGADPSGNFVLESYWPLHAPLLVGFGTWPSTWCSNESGGLFGRLLPACAPPPPPCDRNTTNCCPQCLAELHSRSVPGTLRLGKHAFWYVVDATSNTYIIDAGPSDENCGLSHKCDWLNDWPPFNLRGNPPTHGHYDVDNRNAPLVWTAPSTPQLWSQIASLLFAADNWPNGTIPYVRAGAWNSNTFAHCMGDDAGFTNVTHPPYNSAGWDYPSTGRTTCP